MDIHSRARPTIASLLVLFERCKLGIEFPKISTRLQEDLKQNKIFNDFAISSDPINEIDRDFLYFKDME